jgi:hypothetical protein
VSPARARPSGCACPRPSPSACPPRWPHRGPRRSLAGRPRPYRDPALRRQTGSRPGPERGHAPGSGPAYPVSDARGDSASPTRRHRPLGARQDPVRDI